VPTFANLVTAGAYADDEASYKASAENIPMAFERLELALAKQNAGPFFNGAKYSLVDAAYAPFLQRYFFLDRIKPLGIIENFPRLRAWAQALINRPSTHSFPEAEPFPLSPAMALAVSAITGMRLVAGSALIRWVASSPRMSGSVRSMRMRSGCSELAIAMPCAPSVATTTVKPARESRFFSM
jgi:hypothetical protein